MTDFATRELISSTARQLFESAPSVDEVRRLGWLGLFVDEAQGGEGWNPVEGVLVALQAGFALATAPWSSAALGAAALATTAEGRSLLPAVLDGELSAQFSLAVPRDDGLSFRCRVDVSERPGLLIVADEAGVALGWARLDDRTTFSGDPLELDSTRPMGWIELRPARLTPLAAEATDALVDLATLLACADSVGALDLGYRTVSDHLVQRTAFGARLASFQVLQHRLVDLAVLVDSCRALVLRAGAALAEHRSGAGGLVDAANLHIHSLAPGALDDCIQLAGGVGFTWEFPAHHAMRRATANAAGCRPRTRSAQRLARSRGWSG